MNIGKLLSMLSIIYILGSIITAGNIYHWASCKEENWASCGRQKAGTVYVLSIIWPYYLSVRLWED